MNDVKSTTHSNKIIIVLYSIDMINMIIYVSTAYRWYILHWRH